MNDDGHDDETSTQALTSADAEAKAKTRVSTGKGNYFPFYLFVIVEQGRRLGKFNYRDF